MSPPASNPPPPSGGLSSTWRGRGCWSCCCQRPPGPVSAASAGCPGRRWLSSCRPPRTPTSAAASPPSATSCGGTGWPARRCPLPASPEKVSAKRPGSACLSFPRNWGGKLVAATSLARVSPVCVEARGWRGWMRGGHPAGPVTWSHPGDGLCLAVVGACRPCNDTEILMAICTSDFVIRGSIQSVSNNAELQESVIGVSAARIHRQKFPLFQAGGRPGRLAGSIRTPLRCGVKLGPGTFLFTGWLHFGEAWLSCAPRYRDFQRIYEGARRTRQNPCEFPVD
uniref:Meteorin, glial cell differentiation regulator n=1 Tax=Otus sunia TaxID=257818 RepID=A0A8C8BMI3_9STRI